MPHHRGPPAYKGASPPPRLATPLEELLGDEYESFWAAWEQKEAEMRAHTFHSVPAYRQWRAKQEKAQRSTRSACSE